MFRKKIFDRDTHESRTCIQCPAEHPVISILSIHLTTLVVNNIIIVSFVNHAGSTTSDRSIYSSSACSAAESFELLIKASWRFLFRNLNHSHLHITVCLDTCLLVAVAASIHLCLPDLTFRSNATLGIGKLSMQLLTYAYYHPIHKHLIQSLL